MIPARVSDRPRGSEPADRVQTAVPTPPLVARRRRYARPTVACAGPVGAIASRRATVKPTVAPAVSPSTSVAATVTENEPAVVGVPPTIPLSAVSARRPGRAPFGTDQRSGPIRACEASVALSGTP